MEIRKVDETQAPAAIYCFAQIASNLEAGYLTAMTARQADDLDDDARDTVIEIEEGAIDRAQNAAIEEAISGMFAGLEAGEIYKRMVIAYMEAR